MRCNFISPQTLTFTLSPFILYGHLKPDINDVVGCGLVRNPISH